MRSKEPTTLWRSVGFVEIPMTTMIDRFFGMPQALLRKGLLCDLSPTAIKLLVAIYHESERHSTRRLERSTAELKLLTGCSRNSLANARTELVISGLVQIEVNKQQEFVKYTQAKFGGTWLKDVLPK